MAMITGPTCLNVGVMETAVTKYDFKMTDRKD